jgi:coenzyme F420 hydrogenase subunit beta
MAEIRKKERISSVVETKLCTGCGTCFAFCPNEAIEIVLDAKREIYIPELNDSKCNNCGVCFKVCPGYKVDFKSLNSELFGKTPDDILIGNYLSCYAGNAKKHNIRYNSTSGGLVTALLIFALEEGLIDGALVTRMNKDKPLEPEPFIARTEKEIFEAMGSKYCPVPTNVILKDILEAKNGERFAFVGLPCHIHGLRKAEQINKELKKKIVLSIGIFCSHVDSFQATRYLLKQMRLKAQNVKELKYRSGGWPGKMQVKLTNSEIHEFDYHEYVKITHAHNFFTPSRCFRCCDLTAELADVSCGDAWLPEYKSDNVGKSMIIVRTKQGQDLVNKSLTKEFIELNLIDRKKVVEAQGITFKKISTPEKLDINCGATLVRPNTRDKLSAVNQSIAYNLGRIPNQFALKPYVYFTTLIGKFLARR